MDDILASIRRIIADEDLSSDMNAPAERREAETRAPLHRPAAMPGPRLDEPLRFTPPPADAYAGVARAPEQGDAGHAPQAGEPPVSVRRPEPPRMQPAPRPAYTHAAEPARAPLEGMRRKDLLSPEADAAVAAAFDSLGEAMLPNQGRTVEDLMKDMLRPMLKTWLDANLPRIVERLVRQEIERIARTPR